MLVLIYLIIFPISRFSIYNLLNAKLYLIMREGCGNMDNNQILIILMNNNFRLDRNNKMAGMMMKMMNPMGSMPVSHHSIRVTA